MRGWEEVKKKKKKKEEKRKKETERNIAFRIMRVPRSVFKSFRIFFNWIFQPDFPYSRLISLKFTSPSPVPCTQLINSTPRFYENRLILSQGLTKINNMILFRECSKIFFFFGEEGNNEKVKKVLGELEIIFNFNIILIFRKWVDFVDGRILDNISKNKG